jgi:hypothetical protein
MTLVNNGRGKNIEFRVMPNGNGDGRWYWEVIADGARLWSVVSRTLNLWPAKQPVTQPAKRDLSNNKPRTDLPILKATLDGPSACAPMLNRSKPSNVIAAIGIARINVSPATVALPDRA